MASETGWGWYWSSCEGEPYTGPHDTRDDAIKAAKESVFADEAVYLIEARKTATSIAKQIPAYKVVDFVIENIADLGDESGENLPDIDEESDLVLAIRKAIKSHDEAIIPFAFDQTRNEEILEPGPLLNKDERKD